MDNHPEESATDKPEEVKPKLSDNRMALMTILGTLIFIVSAIVLGYVLKFPPLATFKPTLMGLVWGLLAVLPMLLILLILEKSSHPIVTKFREDQTQYFANIGFRFTPIRILLLSLGAGFGEEMFFRGVLQVVLSRDLPLTVAILITSIIFGLLHAVNKTYIVIATIISIYLGVMFVLTDNIMVPIICHTVYDIIAFIYTAKLIERWQIDHTPQENP